MTTVLVNITATIDNEYANRCPEWLPEHIKQGRNRVTRELAQAMLADAEYNSDKKAFDVGEYGMPLPVFNAYRALANQLRKELAK